MIPGVLGLSTALAAVLASACVAPASAAKAAQAAPPAVTRPAVAAAPVTFTHPGVDLSAGQLDFVRSKVLANAQPWKAAYDQMMASSYASLSRTAKPRATVECGPTSMPNNGCTDEREDAIAAYTDALAWYINRDDRYAQKSVQLMDAWSGSIKTHTNDNAPLQTGWAGSSWPKAAEIIKSVYGNWPNSARFGTMLRNVYLPQVVNGSNRTGNWDLTMLEAAVGISVFLDDRTSYDKAIGHYLQRVPAFIYLSSDGALPKTVPSQNLTTRDQIVGFWFGAGTFVTGMTQETCRDFTHTGYGISSIAHVAETALIQGQDLYPQVGERLRQALGFQAKYELQAEPVPANVCGGSVTRGLGPVTEVGFNALHTRQGIAMANTQTLTERQRPAGTNNLFVAWETLTNAENPVVPGPGGGTTPPTGVPSGQITGYGGKCVDINAASPANGTAVQLYDCNGSAAQIWTVASDGTVQALGKCLDVTAAGTANGAAVQLYECNGTGSQQWQRAANGTLVNPQSGRCLDATGPSTANGTRLQIWTCTGAANQLWQLPA
jgi:hypothetical protein